jgi:NAD(P)-dependent dehydrogenase (short-subunit alcohol dehydrogenase family)
VVAHEFARHGCNVALLARGKERLDSAAREARALGVEALSIPVDVADAAAVDSAAERIEHELGPIDVRRASIPRSRPGWPSTDIWHSKCSALMPSAKPIRE